MSGFLKKYTPLFLRGAAMGAADVIPGVSGGTIAFITGIYEELLRSIKSAPSALIILVRTRNIRFFWNEVNGSFLLSVFVGIGVSIISLAALLKYILTEFPLLINGFFFGLIAASAVVIGLTIKPFNIKTLLPLAAGAVVAYYISTATPAATPDEMWFIFLAGTIAISAMILPGISGSFILLLMGKYEVILGAISSLNFGILLVFGAGCVVGLFSFAQVLSKMFKHYKSLTLALLTGFMAGSLAKVWPWKETIETRINSKGEEVPFLQENILPGAFNGDPQVLFTLLLAFAGAGIVVALQWAQSMKKE